MDPAVASTPLDQRVAQALSDEYSRRILSVCVRRALAVRDIEQATSLPQATVYRHIARLAEEGLLFVERSALTADGKRYELYRCRFRSARIEVDATGVRIVWEPNEGVEERLARVWSALRGGS